jgi:hypothetical protein
VVASKNCFGLSLNTYFTFGRITAVPVILSPSAGSQYAKMPFFTSFRI